MTVWLVYIIIICTVQCDNVHRQPVLVSYCVILWSGMGICFFLTKVEKKRRIHRGFHCLAIDSTEKIN